MNYWPLTTTKIFMSGNCLYIPQYGRYFLRSHVQSSNFIDAPYKKYDEKRLRFYNCQPLVFEKYLHNFMILWDFTTELTSLEGFIVSLQLVTMITWEGPKVNVVWQAVINKHVTSWRDTSKILTCKQNICTSPQIEVSNEQVSFQFP